MASTMIINCPKNRTIYEPCMLFQKQHSDPICALLPTNTHHASLWKHEPVKVVPTVTDFVGLSTYFTFDLSI